MGSETFTKLDILELNAGILAYNSINNMLDNTANFVYNVGYNKRKIKSEVESIKEAQDVILKDYRKEYNFLIKEKYTVKDSPEKPLTKEEKQILQENLNIEFNSSEDKKDLDLKHEKALKEHNKFLSEGCVVELHKCEIPKSILNNPQIATCFYIMMKEQVEEISNSNEENQ